ncbi:MAG TPA: ABC transporter permease [Thermoanaerobaculia bacterium]|nr:ABC transporter permease [Thermoanaerobaculia bacterium]
MIGMTGMTAAAPWTEVWGARELLRSLAVRNLKVKYQRSTLGFAWTLINPLLTLTVLAAVFTHVVKIAVPHYWAFLLSGYFVWNYLLQMISTATYVLAEHAGLRRSVAFPSEVLVLSAAASRLAEFAVEMALVVAALAVCHHSGVPASFSLLPLLVLLLILLSLGLVLPLAVLAAFYNDVQHAVPILLMMLFYASPVFYPVRLVPEAVRRLYFLNPIAGLLTLYHQVLYEGRFPPPALLGGVAAASVLLFLIGYAIFNRYKTVLAEIL